MAQETLWLVHKSQLQRETMARFLESRGWDGVRCWEAVDPVAGQLAPEDPPAETVTPPDLLVIDLNALRSKAWALKRLCETPARVVLASDDLHLNDLRVGLRFGIAGYLLYSAAPDAFALSLRLVLAGEKVFPPQLASAVVSGKAAVREERRNGEGPGRPSLLGYPDLNPLDLEILEFLVGGSTNKQIALALNLSEEMVKLHLMQTMRKINVRNRTQAALWMVQSGIRPKPDSAGVP